MQLSSALRTIHTAGLACRVMDPTKILICAKSRLKVNCVGIFDVLTFDQANPLAMISHYQVCLFCFCFCFFACRYGQVAQMFWRVRVLVGMLVNGEFSPGVLN